MIQCVLSLQFDMEEGEEEEEDDEDEAGEDGDTKDQVLCSMAIDNYM